MRIGVAEDVTLLREGIRSILQDAGHDVLWTVSDATELRFRFENHPAPETRPELLIVDVRMPPGHTDDGLRAAIAIRSGYPQIGILVVSQYLGNEYAKELLGSAPESNGGTGYLLKERIGRIGDFLEAVETVGAGGTTIDPKVVAHLLALPKRAVPLSGLTDRESEVLRFVAAGRTNSQIEAALHLSAPTVEKHVSSIFMKLGLHSGDGNRRILAVLHYLNA
ncbi:response regulator transcription factor [Marisediminicola sp. LYQ85]|uniref:response regulator transcription factor n=1 Tax=Marisediminicola sp. LYQ85 TaxID=3391062 RepID=UPI003983A76A